MRWGRGRSYASHTNYGFGSPGWRNPSAYTSHADYRLGRLRRGHLPTYTAHTHHWFGWPGWRHLSAYPAHANYWFGWPCGRNLPTYAAHTDHRLRRLGWGHLSAYPAHPNYRFGRLGRRDLSAYPPHADYWSCWLLSGPRIYLGIWRCCGTMCSKLIVMPRLRPSIRSVYGVKNLLLPIWQRWLGCGNPPAYPAHANHWACWLSWWNPSPYTTHTDYRSGLFGLGDLHHTHLAAHLLLSALAGCPVGCGQGSHPLIQEPFLHSLL